MTVVRPLLRGPMLSALVLAVLGLVLLAIPWGPSVAVATPGHPTAVRSSGMGPAESRDDPVLPSDVSIFEVGPPPTEAVVGDPVPFLWQALGPGGARVNSFTCACELEVGISSDDLAEPAWVNSSVAGPVLASNGVFPIPAAAWSHGVLGLNVTPGSAAPIYVWLTVVMGPALGEVPAPVEFPVLPDLVHLVLYDPKPSIVDPSTGTNDTFWHVRDRFGDPTPGAFLTLTYSTSTSVTKTVEPVTWASGGTTGAWVNYSALGTGNGTFTVTDAANTLLIGPTPVSAPATAPATAPTAALPPLALGAVVLVGLGGFVGIALVAGGGRRRPASAPTDGEEELRRLAEGRETVVEILRRAGPLSMAEIESAWEPPPAPAAVADWVASLVTDGTLTASLGDGDRARFAVAERASEELKVTFDEATLEREMARRDRAAEGKNEEAP